MDSAVVRSVRFDPRDCPLLQGLSPEEQRVRMREDPRIRACIAVVEGTARPSEKTAKGVSAYRCCKRLAEVQSAHD